MPALSMVVEDIFAVGKNATSTGLALTSTTTTATTSTSTSSNSHPTLTQSSVTISGDSSEIYNVSGNNISVNIGANNTSPIFITGNNNILKLPAASSGFSITDDGQATVINLASFASATDSTITINDFQLDPTGSIILPNLYATAASAVAALQSDGQGGSILSLGNGASLHFVDDANLTAASFRVVPGIM